MRTFTITVQNEQDAALLQQLLKEANFKAPVETFAENDDDLGEETLTMLEERMVRYKADPSTGVKWEDLKRELGNDI